MPSLSRAWVGHLLLEEGQRLLYSPSETEEKSHRRIPLLAFQSRASRASLEAKGIEAVDALLAVRIRTYNEHGLHSSLRSKTPQETRKEALTTSKVRIP